MYNYADFHPNVFNKDFDLVRSEWMEETLRLLNQVSTSKVEEALSNMAPVQLAVETPFVGTPVRSPDAPETSNIKLAWLNVSDNTSAVLCNTTVAVQSSRCSAPQQLRASGHLNTSYFFDYARNHPDPYGSLHMNQYTPGDRWSDPRLGRATLSYRP